MTVFSERPVGDDSRIPTPALLLGAAGLIPFVVCGIGPHVIADPALSFTLAEAGRYYGAVILSFLGGIRWGFAMHPLHQDGRTVQLTLAVLPSLIGWGALLIAPLAGVLVLVAGLLLQLVLDLSLVRQARAPVWFARLRTGLTVGACLSLAALAAWLA